MGKYKNRNDFLFVRKMLIWVSFLAAASRPQKSNTKGNNMRHSSSAAVAASPNEEYSRRDTRPSPRPSPRADLSERGGRGVERRRLSVCGTGFAELYPQSSPLQGGSSAQQKNDGVLIIGNRSSFDASG